MLVLSRKIGERIRIGDDVVLTVVRIHGDKVRLGIDAPGDVTIHREEVYRRLRTPAAGPGAEIDDARPRTPIDPDGGIDASLSTGRSDR